MGELGVGGGGVGGHCVIFFFFLCRCKPVILGLR